MRKEIFHRTIALFLSVLFVHVALSQQPATVKATVDRDSILIGEPILLQLEADIPENAPIRFFAIDTIPHFEFLDRGKIDTTNTSEGTRLSRTMRITSFDSGHWVIPALSIGGEVLTDSIPVDVGFSEFDRSQDYHDVKDIIDVEQEEKKNEWWWYLIGGGLLLLLVVVIILMRRKKVKPEIVAPPVDPYKEAVEGLRQLRGRNKERKEYYSGLVDVFRLYIFRRKGIQSLQKTTDDLVIQLKGIGMHRENFDSLSQALRLSDYVKFAKYVPDEIDDVNAFDAISKAIDEIEQTK
jgi:hypothetical protein